MGESRPQLVKYQRFGSACDQSCQSKASGFDCAGTRLKHQLCLSGTVTCCCFEMVNYYLRYLQVESLMLFLLP